MPKDEDDIQPDLFEAVDSLLEEIEETTQTFAPEEEKAIDPNALITDDGQNVVPNRPATDTESADTESTATEPEPETEATAEAETADAIEEVEQALDEVEQQTDDLLTQSVDALLEMDTESLPEVSEVQSVEEKSVEESASESDSETVASSLGDEQEIDTQELFASIDQLLEADNHESVSDESSSETEESVEATTEANESTESIDDLSDAIEHLLEDQDPAIDPPANVDRVEQAQDASDEDLPLEMSEEELAEIESQLTKETTTASKDEYVDTLEGSFDDALDGSLDDSMDMLDEALSEAADDMLEGDFETEEGELVSGEAVATAIEETLLGDVVTPQPPVESVDASDTTEHEAISDDLLAEVADAVMSGAEQAETNDSTDLTATPKEAAQETTQEPAPAAQTDAPAVVTDEEPAKPAPATSTAPAASKPAESEPAAAIDDPEILSEIDALEESQTSEPAATPLWFERAIEIARPKIDRIDPLKGKSMDVFAMAIGTALVAIKIHATPIVAKIMLLLSKPLAKQTPEVRNAVGYIALWTGFLAAVLWIYLLMFRAPSIPEPDTAPTRVISIDEPLVPVRAVLPTP